MRSHNNTFVNLERHCHRWHCEHLVQGHHTEWSSETFLQERSCFSRYQEKHTVTFHLLDLPAAFSCFGQIPRDDVDKQSSSSGVTWMPTSTGLDAFFSSLGEGEGGLSTAFSKQRLPLHCFRLCSIKIRMSPNGKFIWHWPQVRRSWSPSPVPNVLLSGSSSVKMASTGSAAGWKTKEKNISSLEKEKIWGN